MSSSNRTACEQCVRLQLHILQAGQEMQSLYMAYNQERALNLQTGYILQVQQRQLNDLQLKLSHTMLATQAELMKRSGA